MRRLDDADRSLRRALDLAKTLATGEIEPLALAGLSDVTYSRGDLPGAERKAQEALAQATRLNLVFVGAWVRWRLAVRAAERGRHAQALQAYREALDLMEEIRGQLQEASLRSVFLEDKQTLYHGAVRSALALGQPADAFAFAERARAFLDLLGNQTPLSKGRTRALVDEEVRLRAQLAEAHAVAQGELGPAEPAQARQRLDAAERAYRAFLDRVRRENAEQASLMTVDPVTLPEIQGLLPEGTTLLEYLVTDAETLLWVIGRQRLEVLRLPIPREALVAQVRALRQAIADRAPLPAVQAQARALYDHLLAPARPHLQADRLLIVPHDILHYLPFGALRTPEGHWLIEDYTLSTLPSASVLRFLQEKERGANDGTRAVGNPDVGPALNLRYAAWEARAVGAHYPGATVLVGAQATEPKIKALSGRAGLLHFATHGELSEKDPLSSALLLVPEGTDDGRLEVRKIFGLDLHARLVVLSACETGLGKLSRGDELVGLLRAFLYAGTPAVVTTLWPVDDRASYYLMRTFYDHLQAEGAAEALRQAQRTTMAEFPHPFAWAAFGLTGVPK